MFGGPGRRGLPRGDALKKKSARKPAAKAPTPAPPAPPAADATVQAEWLRRVEAEYRSGAHAQHLTLWLMQLGAPPDLIEQGLDVVRDELLHAELSDNVFRAAGGTGAPELSRESLALTRHPSEALEFDVLRVAVEMFCLGETVAVRLFSRLRDQSSVPVVREALDQILRDEVRHREFGWALLEWLLSTPLAQTFRTRLAQDLPGMLERVRRNYGGVALDKLGAEKLSRMAAAMNPVARAWGVMPVSDYVAAVEETLSRDYVPRFAALGVVW